ncbi:HGGxSTG domain-containing protein [Polynucleobacter finlandensis]|uniref:HGGxSTG domain-containing protein n=1 Tax=Polynucleobacter finlandensis TaxID=1855894 RepID=UPI0034E1B212
MHCSPRCGAHARTTGKPCKSPAMPNGRCRMHGGRTPIKHGLRSRLFKKKQHEMRGLLRILGK